MTDQGVYLAAAERYDFGPHLHTYCPECSEHVNPDTDDGRHTFTTKGMLVIGCQGYFVHDPALLGIDRGQWENWRPARAEDAELAEGQPLQ